MLPTAHTEVRAGPNSEITCVRGDAFAISGTSGDLLPGGVDGLYVRDTRFLDTLQVRVDGSWPVMLTGAAVDSARAVFHGHVRVPDAGSDPVLLVDRRRVVDGSLHEEVRLTNCSGRPRTVEVRWVVGTDLAYIFDVRHGRVLDRPPVTQVPGGVRFERVEGETSVVVRTDPPPGRVEGEELVRRVHLAPGSSDRWCVDVEVSDVYGVAGPARRCESLEHGPVTATDRGRSSPGVRIASSDHHLELLARRSLADVATLQVRDPAAPADRFCAAGSPWYLTLFGRDSLWAAMMALPFDVGLAGGTLRALARRQGVVDDPDTEEAPGRILHEIRRGSLAHRGDLPPNYYGTVDATPLFVALVHEAWRWGLPASQVAALLPNVRAALEWVAATVELHPGGFLAYHQTHDRGLVNQGWKDSHDGIQWTDGTLARPPVALAEVQGYAHDAARRGAELLDELGGGDGDRWRGWAAGLAARFRRDFWVEDDHGRYPAIAVDGDGDPVDGPASNMGHLLAGALLDDAEASLVAAQLAHRRLSSGWGLRTLSATAEGFNPLGYHTGSVWPHDTAIAVAGLAARGHRDEAATLLSGLVDVAAAFDHRLPELFGGHERDDALVPVPYPAACRPQAWASSGVLLLVRACLGLDVDVPRARLRVAPPWPPLVRSLTVTGLSVAGGTLDVTVDAGTGVDVRVDGVALEVEVVGPSDDRLRE